MQALKTRAYFFNKILLVIIMSYEQELTEMSELYHKGFVGNPEIFEEILADDFREVDAEGNIWDRAGFINKVATKHKEMYSENAHIRIDEIDIRVFEQGFGQVHAMVTLIDNDKEVGTIRYTDTYINKDNVWKAVSAHITPYEKKH